MCCQTAYFDNISNWLFSKSKIESKDAQLFETFGSQIIIQILYIYNIKSTEIICECIH